jgi:hypothetical protein
MKFLFFLFNLLISHYIYANNLFAIQDSQKNDILFSYNFTRYVNDDIISQINSNKTEDFNSELSNSQIEPKITHLNSTEDLDLTVHKEFNNENGHLLNDALPNNNSPLMQSHYDFAKIVAKHTKEQLNNLISNLKQSK